MSRVTIANSHLQMQAEMSFGAELSFYQGPSWQESKSVLDLGCGNGAYLKKLADHFSLKQFTGLDIDKEFHDSIALPSSSNLLVRTGAFESLESHFDVLHMRFVFMYLDDPKILMKWAQKNVRKSVFQIDPEDSKFVLEPDLPLFRKVFEDMETRVKRLGGTSRKVDESTIDNWCSHGFNLESTDTVIITSEAPFSRKLMHLLMVLNAEVVLGRPLPNELYMELLNWYFSEGYVQYGVTRRLFSRA